MNTALGAYSFLPDLTEDQIRRQVDYCIANDWAIAIEFADEVRSRNTQWESWGLPLFDARDAAAVLAEIRACREAHPAHHVRISAFDPSRGWETVRLSFIINRPRAEPAFRHERGDLQSRALRFRAQAQAQTQPFRPERRLARA